MRRRSPVVDVLLFATAFFVTFTKVRVTVADNYVFVSDVTATLFILAFLVHCARDRAWAVPRTVAVVAAFFGVFLLVYLVGFFNLGTAEDRDLYVKGMAKFLIHFSLLVTAVAYLAGRSRLLYWQALGCYVAGFVANAAYGLLQLTLAETTGANLDEMILGRLGLYDQGGVNIYGSVGDANVYRTTALTLDPNHLAVMLVIPLLVLFPLYLRLGRGHALRTPLAVVLVGLTVVELSTLSRSGLLGVAVGVIVLAAPYRHLFLKPRVLVPLGALAAIGAAVVLQRLAFFQVVFEARTQTNSPGVQTHLGFYSLVRPALEQHPLFGLGLNTFEVYYEFLTGRTNYGPHSFYVALLTQTGIVGTLVYGAWLVYLFRRIGSLQRIGRHLAQAGERFSARVRPLAWGLTAALLGTMAGNLFYLTMQMYYFIVFAIFVASAPLVFGPAWRAGRR